MKLDFIQEKPGYADGVCRISEAGSEPITLFWGNEDGPLADCMPLGLLLPDGTGRAERHFGGDRSIPPEACFLLAQSGSDFAAAPVVGSGPTPMEKPLRIAVMSDLHLTRKCWRLEKAFRLARNADLILLPGDLTNDGTQPQFQLLQRTIDNFFPTTPVLAVTGNHDIPRLPSPALRRDICDYPALQSWLLARQQHPFAQDHSGAYAVTLGDVDVLGLNAVTHFRKFCFPEEEQLDRLERYLAESTAQVHLVLCHMPLMAHNPQGWRAYLSGNKRFQQILDSGRNIIFLSGHTHISMQSPGNFADCDGRNLYLNDGSLCLTQLLTDEERCPDCFTDGNILELALWPKLLEVTARSIRDGRRLSRGFYRFSLPFGALDP